jgi:hypothetical protein
MIKTKRTVETEITRVPTDQPFNKKKKLNLKYFDSYLKYGFIDVESEYSQPLTWNPVFNYRIERWNRYKSFIALSFGLFVWKCIFEFNLSKK